jgi:hypothetical protein
MINTLPNHILDAFLILFADDTNAILTGTTEELNDLLTKAKKCINDVDAWMQRHFLKLNVKKTQMLLLGKKHVLNKIGKIGIKIGDTYLESVDSIKSLGLTIDSELTWNEHLNQLSKKCNSTLYSLYPIQKMLNRANRNICIQSYIFSQIRYMSIIWGLASNKLIKPIDTIIHRCARFVLDLHKYDNTTDAMANDLKWLNARNMHYVELAKFAYSIRHKTCPAIFTNTMLPTDILGMKTRNKFYNKSTVSKNSVIYHSLNIAKECESDILIFSQNKFIIKTIEKCLQEQSAQSVQSQRNVCNLSCIESVVQRCT